MILMGVGPLVVLKQIEYSLSIPKGSDPLLDPLLIIRMIQLVWIFGSQQMNGVGHPYSAALSPVRNMISLRSHSDLSADLTVRVIP